MVIWTIWFLVAMVVIAAKYSTTKTIVAMTVRFSKQDKLLAASRTECKVIRNNLAIAKRSLTLTQRAIAEDQRQIQELKRELKALEEEDRCEMQEAKRMLSQTKSPFGGI